MVKGDRSNRYMRILDLSIVAFILPYIAVSVLGIYAWSKEGFSILYPSKAFLVVTKNPLLFLFGCLSTYIALIMYVKGLGDQEREYALNSASDIMVWSSIFTLFSAYLVAVWGSGGAYEAFDLLLEGRFSSLYPVMLLLTAFLLRIRIPSGFKKDLKHLLSSIFPILVLPVYYFITMHIIKGLSFVHFSWTLILLLIVVATIQKMLLKRLDLNVNQRKSE